MLSAAIYLATLPSFPFIDEGKSDPQFALFRDNLIHAIKNDNLEWATNRIASDIKFSFGAEGGKQDLLESWAGAPEAKRNFYSELLTVLELGGQFKSYDSRRYFVAPYVFSAWPDEFDAFEYMAVIGKDRAVFAGPDATLKPEATLAFTIVKRGYPPDAKEGWVNIEYDADKWGWIDEGSVRSPIDYRAMFEKRRGSYYLVTFVAGD
jgi:hypothetical protein